MNEGDALFRCRSRDFVLALLLGTVENKIVAKKTHKMEKSADFFGGFLHFKEGISSVRNALEAISEPVSLYDPVFNDGEDAIYIMDQLLYDLLFFS